MKLSICLMSVSVSALLATPCRAEDAPPAPSGIVIGGSAAAPAISQTCVDVQVGASVRSFACLNQSLSREVQKINPTLNAPPLDARSADHKIGVVNIPGVRQQYGQNFGVSAVPFRPAVTVVNRPGPLGR